jgi:hypothetical protein
MLYRRYNEKALVCVIPIKIRVLLIEFTQISAHMLFIFIT